MNLCQDQKVNALKEITRSISNNQLDHILIDKNLIYFVTSYNNFISDHKSIAARIGLEGNELTDEVREGLTFNQDCHMKKTKLLDSSVDQDQTSEEEQHDITEFEQSRYQEEHPGQSKNQANEDIDYIQKNRKSPESNRPKYQFRRKFVNPDLATCWLNSCLQLILIAMDYDESTKVFNSELGKELLRLQSNQNESLNPLNVKDILVSSEDMRIATRLSELTSEITDQIELEDQTRNIQNMRLDLRRGQQCVRDFFICLNENLLSWPDVYSTFSFKLTHSTECLSCKHINHHETNQSYFEIPVPPNNADLNDHVEDFLNEESLVGVFCDDGCKNLAQKIKRTRLNCSNQAGFILVVLTRGLDGEEGFQLVENKTISINDIFIR